MWYWLILIILLFLIFKSNFATGGGGRGRFHGIGPDISGRPGDPELQFKLSTTPQFYSVMG
jgi:hypothetical protein